MLFEIGCKKAEHRRQRRRLIGRGETLPPRDEVAHIRLLRGLIERVQRGADRLHLGGSVGLLRHRRYDRAHDRASKDKCWKKAQSPRAITQFHAAFRFLMRSSTTVGSASVDVSPSAPNSFSAILRRMRRMILPERVFGRPGAN